MESQAFVLHCTGVISPAGVEAMKLEGNPVFPAANQGGSCVIGPDGRVLSGLGTENEKLIIADLDLSEVTKTRTFADAGGHCELFFLALFM